MFSRINHAVLKLRGMFKFVNIRMITTVKGRRPPITKGLLRPYFDLQLSVKKPIIGSLIASHRTAIREMDPAIAGLIPATVVKKKIKYT